MAYTINKTDGSVLTTITDGTLDETTNISLPGKAYTGYGEVLNEDLVKLLENFANTSANAPNKPITGQLFYDTTLDQMQVYDGTQFKATAGTIVSATAPSYGAQGDLWYSTNTTQVYAYTGLIWNLIGPLNSTSTGAYAERVTDNAGTLQDVIKLTAGNNLVGIISNTEFTPQTSITGFQTVNKGITLTTAIADTKFQGTATDADALGGVAAASYLRSDASDVTSGTLTVENDASLILGADGDIIFSQQDSDFTIRNATSNGDIILRVNDGGITATALTIDGETAGVVVQNILTVNTSVSSPEISGTTSVTSPLIKTNQIESDDSTEVVVNDGLVVKGNVTADNLVGNITTSSTGVVSLAMLSSAVTLVIYDSSGSAVKTLYGAGA
jgi:hypothetical protein